MCITRRFIEKVHDAFDELNYRETEKLDFDKFMECSIKTLTHTKEITDAKTAAVLCNFCIKKWRKIEKIFKKKLHVLNEYEYVGNYLIQKTTKKKASGTYYITNGMSKKCNQILAASVDFDENFYFDNHRGVYSAYEDGDYFITRKNLSPSQMTLFNKKGNLLATILYRDGFLLKNNRTPYELIEIDEGFIGVFNRDYINSLSEDEDIDIDKRVADIEWDILGNGTLLGIAKLSIYEDVDFEMLLFFALSTFITFWGYIESLRATALAFHGLRG